MPATPHSHTAPPLSASAAAPPAGQSYFSGRKLIIASMHKKEAVIAPLLEKAFQLQCCLADGLNTDQWGTFSGEISRKGSALEAARAKCLQAMELSGCDLALASEGSFGAHPSYPFLPANEELLLLVDKQHALEIASSVIRLETNYGGETITTEEALLRFAERALFPSHALILRGTGAAAPATYKGITDWKQLRQLFQQLRQTAEQVHVETDMRALYNPSRMDVIAAATRKLMEAMQKCCPHCGTPGYCIVEYCSGLPCRLCQAPTSAAKSVIYQCQKCSLRQEERHAHFADPADCHTCNP